MVSVRSLLRRGESAAVPPLRARKSFVAGLVVAVIGVLSLSVAAFANSLPVTSGRAETITTPSTTTTPAGGTDLPTDSSAYNSAWQSAPAGYATPRNDGLGVAPGQIGHVWVIVLENHAYDANFTPLDGTQNSYAQTLPSQGALLTNYYGAGHSSLDNYLAMTSGQAPLQDDEDDCPSYGAINTSTPATFTGTDDHGIDATGDLASNADYGQLVSGAGADAPADDNGCVYPQNVATIFNQLDAASKTWKVYAQDLGGTVNGGVADSSAGSADTEPAADDLEDASANTDGHDSGTADCGAPDSSLGSTPTSSAAGTYAANPSSATEWDQYVAKHNPLAWFQSLLPSGALGGDSTDCADGLGHASDGIDNNVDSDHLAAMFGPDDALYKDLQHVDTTPDFSYIVPDNCSNGHDAVCAGNNLSGMSAYPADNTSSAIPASVNDTGGTYAESQFLSIVIPEIEASPAFKQNGLIVVTYDESYPPATYSNDSTANSQLQLPDAAGVLESDAAGETLYGRSLNWEPTGPNSTIVTSPTGQVLSAGPGDSADLDRPSNVPGLIDCTDPTGTGGASTKGDPWVAFTTPTPTNGTCIPGFQAGTTSYSSSKVTISVAAGASQISGTVTQSNDGDLATLPSGTEFTDDGTTYTVGTGTPPALYVGDVLDTEQQATAPSGASPKGTVDSSTFELIDGSGNVITFPSALSSVSLSVQRASTATDPFYDAFDPTLGGGDSGAVLISPFITPGTVSNTYYNHYSLLRSLEDIFEFPSDAQTNSSCDDRSEGYGSGKSYFTLSGNSADVCGLDGTGYLGFAAQPGLAPFGPDVFTNAELSFPMPFGHIRSVSRR